MADIIKGTGTSHDLTMRDRKRISVTGVTEVVSFDELSVVLKTVCGELTVDGEGLHISAIDTTHGTLEIEGSVKALSYFDKKRDSGKSVLGRIFK